MSLVTDATGTALAIIYDMNVMEIALAIPKFSIDRRFGKPEQILIVAGKACTIHAFSVWDVDRGRIVPSEHTEIIRAVWVMAGNAFAFFYRPMQIFFLFKVFFNVSQRRGTQVVLVMAAKACCHLVKRQQSFVCRIVSRVAGTAAPLLAQRFVRYLYTGQFFSNSAMAPNTEIRNSLPENFADRRSMRIVTGTTGPFLDRWMGYFGLFQIFGKIRVALEADITDGSVKECFFTGFMRFMTFIAGADGNGTVHIRLLEWLGAMACDTEFCAIVTYVQ